MNCTLASFRDISWSRFRRGHGHTLFTAGGQPRYGMSGANTRLEIYKVVNTLCMNNENFAFRSTPKQHCNRLPKLM